MGLVALVTLDLGVTDKRDAFYEALKRIKGWSKLPAKLIKDSWQVRFPDSWKIPEAKAEIQKDLEKASIESKLQSYEAAVCVGPEEILIIGK